PDGDLRQRSHRSGRPPLEDPDQREREAARFPLGAAGGRPQRDLRLDRGGGGADGRCLPRGLRPASARAAPLRAHRRDRRREWRPRGPGRDGRRDADRADVVGSPARRPGLAGGRPPGRGRPGADRRTEPDQGGHGGMRAMVLAAGLGTRLRPITYEMPKPMVPVLNRPVMEHILRLLARHGFEETIANLYWFPELIEG